VSAVKALFIGGTGKISQACARRAIDLGMEIHVLNRGLTTNRELPEEVHSLRADIRDPESVKAALGDREFDVVVNFVAYNAEHIRTDLDLFRGRTGQYVFISSASAYQTPPAQVPVTESTPLRNPIWEYSQRKIESEDLLVRAYREEGFPMTIVRPSHTYDRTSVPLVGGWTSIARWRQGKPVVIHGDGTSLWTITHQTDFAKGFVGLLGNPRAIGEAYHITSHEFLTWNQILAYLADAAGVDDPQVVHVASDSIASVDRIWGDAVLGDMAHSMIFDNAKIRSVVPDFVCTIPFQQGAREILDWYDADPARQQVDARIDAAHDRLVKLYQPQAG
jgi:nucleoside-diphosphate-sugar epimerase